MKKIRHALFFVLVVLLLFVSCNGSKPQLRSLTLYPNNGDESSLYRHEIGELMALPETTRNDTGITVESNSIPRDYVLLCWVDGKGNEYAPESNFEFTPEDVTMYAAWELNVCVENLYGNRTIIKSRTNGSYEVPESSLVDSSHTYLADLNGNVLPASGTLVNDDILLVEHRYEYKISFNANGGTGTMADQICYSGIASPISECSFTAPSSLHVFAGWNTRADGTGTAFTDSSSLTGDVVLYAQWIGPTTVTFNANGGSGEMESQIFINGVAQEISANTFSYENMAFAGWNTASDGSGLSYQDRENVSFSCDTVLYAQWEPATCHVTFNANGGVGSMAQQSFTAGKAQYLSANAFTAQDKVFHSWNTQADGLGTSYDDKAFATFDSDVTLYAQWRNLYYVTFDANGGNGTMDVQAFAEGCSQNLSANVFVYYAMFFDSWNTKADGSGTSYADCANVSFSENTTLYAQWKNMVSVEFLRNGGNGGTMDIQYFVPGVAQALNPNTFTADKKVFDGWNTRANGLGGTYYSDGASVSFTNNTILYAQWRDIYEVHFSANGGTGTMEPQYFVQGVSQNISANAFSYKGKAFKSWNTKSDGSGSSYSDGDCIYLYGNTTLYAQWIDQYVITFDGNGVEGFMEPQYYYGGISSDLHLCTFSKPGMVFAGWNTKADGSGVAYEDGKSYPFSCDTVLYAQWEVYVTFDSNGGVGTMDKQTFRVGESKALNACNFTCTDYVFGEWNTQADGSGTSYYDKAVVTLDSHVALYAQWRHAYYVTFDGNGATGSMDSQLFPDGISQELVVNQFIAPKGKIFHSWNTAAEGSGTSYGNRDAISINSDVTLYAQWTEDIGIYEVGDIGPAGGIIFYNCDADNASGNADGLVSSECGWTYLEASVSDIQAIFGYSTTFVETGNAIGTGKTNTEKLVSAMGTAALVSNWQTETTSEYAAYLANTHEEGAYDDWFLPSKDELDLMYKVLKSNGLGNFVSDYYWSSSVNDSDTAWNQVFEGGSQFTNLRNIKRYVRCIRAF